MNEAATELPGQWFDGRSGRAEPVQVWIDGKRLRWVGGGGQITASVDSRSALWPERQRHGQRQIQPPGGGLLVFEDALAFDAWAAASGRHHSVVVVWQQSWALTALALFLVVALLAGTWRWGLPAAAQVGVAWLPEAVGTQMGDQAMGYLDRELLKPSRLDAQTQSDHTRRFAAAASAAQAGTGARAAYQIHFREGGKALGLNAFALPGGHIVLTDALVKMLADKPDALVGVLAHELGHVQHQHGLRLAAQTSALGVIAGLALGDFSVLLAGAPALLAQLGYSRDFEREADAYARELLRAAGISPRVMVEFFDRLAGLGNANEGKLLPIGVSSHPADDERKAFFGR